LVVVASIDIPRLMIASGRPPCSPDRLDDAVYLVRAAGLNCDVARSTTTRAFPSFALGISLRQLISESASNPVVSGYGAPLSVEAFGPSQATDQLNGTKLTNISVSGVSGLTAADIPSLSGSYLPLSGGTLTGAATTTGPFVISSGTFDSGHLLLGGQHVWQDGNGDIWTSSSTPTSATNGMRLLGVQNGPSTPVAGSQMQIDNLLESSRFPLASEAGIWPSTTYTYFGVSKEFNSAYTGAASPATSLFSYAVNNGSTKDVVSVLGDASGSNRQQHCIWCKFHRSEPRRHHKYKTRRS
jgi:hypothetical protein